jgi:hypothetical protein
LVVPGFGCWTALMPIAIAVARITQTRFMELMIVIMLPQGGAAKRMIEGEDDNRRQKCSGISPSPLPQSMNCHQETNEKPDQPQPLQSQHEENHRKI